MSQQDLLGRQGLEWDADPGGAREVLRILLKLVPEDEPLALQPGAHVGDRPHAPGRRYAVMTVCEQVRGENRHGERAAEAERGGREPSTESHQAVQRGEDDGWACDRE